MIETEAHLKKFERFEREAKQPSWVFPLRKAGIARFAELGFPTLKDEDWRFTNVAPIARLPFKPVFGPSQNGVTSQRLKDVIFGQLAASRLVFVNGIYASELSSLGPQKPGIIISNLAGALISHSSLIEKQLGRYAQGEQNAFTALNMAFFQDGAFIYVPAGKIVETPIHLVFV